MTSTLLHVQIETQNHGGAAVRASPALRFAHGHLNNIPGRFLPDRDSADFLPRATSQALRFHSACLGLYHLNAIQNVCRQASTDLFRVRVHLKSLSCSASSSAERKARKAFHDGEKVSHESGQSSQERSHV